MSKRKLGQGMPFRAYADQESRILQYQRKRNIKLIKESKSTLITTQAALRELIETGLCANGLKQPIKENDQSKSIQ